MIKKTYNKNEAVSYAKKWALTRNPNYYNFDKLGGDCTNFVSQCLFAGCKVMNYTDNGWYYSSLNKRSTSWTGVEFLYDFLTANKTIGPFGTIVPLYNVELGDVVQLGNANGNYYHTLIITAIFEDNIYTSSHTIDSLDRPLTSYNYQLIRFIHIEGYRK